MLYLTIFIYGLAIGSFLNLCILRTPKKESIVFPPSHCENCATRLKAWDLVPLVSWLLLKGRCRYCGVALSAKHPLIELLTGTLFVIIYIAKGTTVELFPYLILTALLIVVAFIDLEHFIIPNKVILTGFVFGIGLHIFLPFLTWPDILLGFFTGGGILYLLAVVSKGGMGGGDIKLAAMLGFYLGWQGVLLTLFLGALLASVVWLLLMLFGLKSRKDMVPFGAFLSVAALSTMLFGNHFLVWYLQVISQ